MAQHQSLMDIKAIVYDCDGVLTDNKVLVDEEGREYASFSRADGFAISRISKMGIRQVVISTESNPIVLRRCQKLGLEVYNDVSDKLTTLEQYCKDKDVALERVLYLGNDLNDIGCMRAAGLCGCPSDAEIEIKIISDWISSRKGGEGVVRDLYRDLCESRGIECQ